MDRCWRMGAKIVFGAWARNRVAPWATGRFAGRRRSLWGASLVVVVVALLTPAVAWADIDQHDQLRDAGDPGNELAGVRTRDHEPVPVGRRCLRWLDSGRGSGRVRRRVLVEPGRSRDPEVALDRDGANAHSGTQVLYSHSFCDELLSSVSQFIAQLSTPTNSLSLYAGAIQNVSAPPFAATTVDLTGYDSSGEAVAFDSVTAGTPDNTLLSLTSSAADIAYFSVAIPDGGSEITPTLEIDDLSFVVPPRANRRRRHNRWSFSARRTPRSRSRRAEPSRRRFPCSGSTAPTTRPTYRSVGCRAASPCPARLSLEAAAPRRSRSMPRTASPRRQHSDHDLRDERGRGLDRAAPKDSLTVAAPRRWTFGRVRRSRLRTSPSMWRRAVLSRLRRTPVWTRPRRASASVVHRRRPGWLQRLAVANHAHAAATRFPPESAPAGGAHTPLHLAGRGGQRDYHDQGDGREWRSRLPRL